MSDERAFDALHRSFVRGRRELATSRRHEALSPSELTEMSRLMHERRLAEGSEVRAWVLPDRRAGHGPADALRLAELRRRFDATRGAA